MGQAKSVDQSFTLSAFATSGTSNDEEHFRILQNSFINCVLNIFEDCLGIAFSVNGIKFVDGVVVLCHGSSCLVESFQSCFDCLFIVIYSTGGLSSIQKPLCHFSIRNLEVQSCLARCNGRIKQFSLFNLSGIPVDQIALGCVILRKHSFSNQIENNLERHQLTSCHNCSDFLSFL